MSKLHLKYSAGITEDGNCLLLQGWDHLYGKGQIVKHLELKFLASSPEEASVVSEVYRQAREIKDDGLSLIAVMEIRSDINEANNRHLDYSEYLTIKQQEIKERIQWAYAHAIAEGTSLGFTDEDWDVANGYADDLLMGRAK